MKSINKIFLIISVIPKIGYWNFFYAIWYKLTLKLGFRKNLFKSGPCVEGVFFNSTRKSEDPEIVIFENEIINSAKEILDGKFTWFSFHKFKLEFDPIWFYNPFEKQLHKQTTNHWTEISDFNDGDIKVIWELSRFDWLTVLARAYKISGDVIYLNKLNDLLNDWAKHNPLNIGPNWKCGQEASFRIMKLITTAHLLNQYDQPSTTLKNFIKQHVLRIFPNINYAISQDNNHGTSEAIGLYIGSAWLIYNGDKDIKLIKFKNLGRKILENRIQKLIQKDGTFAQKSMTYHRVVMDTNSFALFNMTKLHEAAFNSKILYKLEKLGSWQYKMTFGSDGDAPNFGSNDGAMIENLHGRPYRDFRPSTQLFFATLKNCRAYDDLSVSQSLYWLLGTESLKWPIYKIDLPKYEILDKQILIMRNDGASLFLKLPEDTFRPGNDAFHIDFWVNGMPILIDSGSYSYNAGELTDYFKSVSAHNTVQFGNHEQMPKISRFLNGKWLKMSPYNQPTIEDDKIQWNGQYKDAYNNIHQRNLSLGKDTLEITDTLNSKENSTVRYHFNDAEGINVHSNMDLNTSKNEVSWFYYEKHEVPVFEATVNVPNVDNPIKFVIEF